MVRILFLAGTYNLLWGGLVICFPSRTLAWAGFDAGHSVELWQCIGMIVGVYGVGYLIASANPFRHWPIVLVGLLGKVFGPLGFLVGVMTGRLPTELGWTLLLNDVVWWIPFSMILWSAIRHHQSLRTVHLSEEYDDPVRELPDQFGRSLDQLSREQRQLVVLIRHSGCTFCRESLAKLTQQREAIERTGCGIVLVHLESEDVMRSFLSAYGLADLPRISDSECRLYRQFGLEIGQFRELFGLYVWIRGFIAGVWNGHGVGRSQGNIFQMPGAFIVHAGRVLHGYKHRTAADRLDFLAMAHSAAEKLAVAESQLAKQSTN